MSSLVETIEGVSWGEGKLLCPRCGDNSLTHGEVFIYTRKEDQVPYQEVSVQPDDTVTVRKAEAGNPSGRRGGITIRFTCEQCGPVQSLAISQHKGETYLSWETTS